MTIIVIEVVDGITNYPRVNDGRRYQCSDIGGGIWKIPPAWRWNERMVADTPEYQGFIEGLAGEQVLGWCWQVGNDSPVTLDLHVDDKVVARFAADNDRGDLAQAGIGSGHHGFISPPLEEDIAAHSIIRVTVAGTDIQLANSGLTLSAYEQRGTPRPRRGSHYVSKHSEFTAMRAAAFTEVGDITSLRTASFANFVLEPSGTMRMPSCRVANRAAADYRIAPCPAVLPDSGFPAALSFPRMIITTLEDAYCLPFGPPFLQVQRKIITEFVNPRTPAYAPWFEYVGHDIYRPNVDIGLEDTKHDIDQAFYLDHSISGHFGHFLCDCLSRMYCWDVVRQIFGDVKLIIGGERTPGDFQNPLLRAAGVRADDIIRVTRLVRCRRLLLATLSLGIEEYASPTSSRLWSILRDRIAPRDISLPSRVYLTRSGISARPLVNEMEVERIFERFGFTIVRPELLSAQQQIAMVSNALLIAGPGGSGMFNLAFQGRLRSAFVIVREDRLNLTEMLVSAGMSCDLWYHLGKDAMSETSLSDGGPWLVDPVRLESDVADWVAASMA